MLNMFRTLSAMDVFYAAVMAFILMQLILNAAGISRNLSKSRKSKAELDSMEKMDAIKKCKTVFHFETVNFRAKVFKKGARVRITTLQKRIIEGEFMGRNEMNTLCVITREHIIAHEIDKIEDITEVTSEEN